MLGPAFCQGPGLPLFTSRPEWSGTGTLAAGMCGQAGIGSWGQRWEVPDRCKPAARGAGVQGSGQAARGRVEARCGARRPCPSRTLQGPCRKRVSRASLTPAPVPCSDCPLHQVLRELGMDPSGTPAKNGGKNSGGGGGGSGGGSGAAAAAAFSADVLMALADRDHDARWVLQLILHCTVWYCRRYCSGCCTFGGLWPAGPAPAARQAEPAGRGPACSCCCPATPACTRPASSLTTRQ